MEVGIERIFKEHVGKGYLQVLPPMAEMLGAQNGDEMLVSNGEKTITRKLLVTDPVEGKYTNPMVVLLDEHDRQELGVNIQEVVLVELKP